MKKRFDLPGDRTRLLHQDLPTSAELVSAVKQMSRVEHGLLALFTVILSVSALGILANINDSLLSAVPAPGGTLIEGVIGSPRFINPLLATSDSDRDLVALVYSGLMRIGADGSLIPDLAKTMNSSDDGRTYTFVLRDELTWHDGEPVTADDVVYTVNQAQNPILKSPKRGSWEGVEVFAVDEKTVQFTLTQPYSSFLENTTLGILPKHIWNNVPTEVFSFSEFNLEPYGSGPYRITKIKRDKSGIPEYYELKPFSDFALGKPYISSVVIRFFPNEDRLLQAYERGEIGAANALQADTVAGLLKMGIPVYATEIALPRVFAVFFNQNQQPLFSRKEVREALSIGVNRERIVLEVLSGYGTAISGPLPPGTLGAENPDLPELNGRTHKEAGRFVLERAGWSADAETGIMHRTIDKKDVSLAFSLVTSNTPELKRAAEIVKSEWEKLGARITLNYFDIGDLNQNIIRPRKYDALFFGQIVGRDPDPFSFWHSSQRNDPGLNVALYTNIAADRALENARSATNNEARVAQYARFQKEIEKDIPAVFLYAPHFLYLLPHDVRGIELASVTTPSERFSGIFDWYIETDRVWKIFLPKREGA
ncbi:MAG: hypothetical protein HYS59_00600 [Candidatus Vogelbacteria bacterium]|nr:hypothetical protein [Candidatus Vogelbacteria bacterium]